MGFTTGKTITGTDITQGTLDALEKGGISFSPLTVFAFDNTEEAINYILKKNRAELTKAFGKGEKGVIEIRVVLRTEPDDYENF
jgi:hypothetical protein